MADYTFISSEDGYFDVLVDATFEQSLPPENMSNILQTILQVVKSEAARDIFFTGIAHLEIDLNNLRLQFRFSEQKEGIDNLSEVERDELPRKSSQFMMHLFAKIDNIHKLRDVPFPATFRMFIDLDS